MTSTIEYLGHLRCQCVHLQSGSVMETDAPTDNQGKGERFSPTDTVCVALATCIITTMGIKAEAMDIDLAGTRLEVTKHMLSDPRRIGKIEIRIFLTSKTEISEKDRQILERVGNHCPVARSLHPDLEKNVEYIWT